MIKYFFKKNKYSAKKTTVDGKTFHSKAEADFYQLLTLQKAAGEVSCVLRQVPIDLPGNVKYFADFLVFYPNGELAFFDVKGKDTPMSIMKRKQVRELYPFEIKTVINGKIQP